MIYLVEKKVQGELFAPLMPASVAERLKDDRVFLVGAVEEQQAVGAAVLELQKDRVQLLSVAVAPKWRRRGIGRALMERCVTLVQATCAQSFYAVLGADVGELGAFFNALTWFQPREEAVCYQVSLGELRGVALLTGSASKARALEDVDYYSYQKYLTATFVADHTQCARQQLDQRVSQVIWEEGKITACILFSRTEQGLSLSWIQNKSRDKLALLYLLRAAMAAACRYYPDSAQITFSADTPQVLQLALRLLGKQTRREAMHAWEISDFALSLFEEEQPLSAR